MGVCRPMLQPRPAVFGRRRDGHFEALAKAAFAIDEIGEIRSAPLAGRPHAPVNRAPSIAVEAQFQGVFATRAEPVEAELLVKAYVEADAGSPAREGPVGLAQEAEGVAEIDLVLVENEMLDGAIPCGHAHVGLTAPHASRTPIGSSRPNVTL